MNILKNPFAKSTTPTDPPETVSLDAAEKAKKRWQLEQGRTKARVETLAADVDASQRAVEQARHTLGERRVDGLDTTAATEALRQAEGQLREDQAALVVAQHKDAEAQRALADATRQASDAADDEVVAAAKASALKMEKLLCGEVKLAADELAAALQAVIDRSASDSVVGSARTDLRAWFPCYLHRACASMITDGQLHAEVIDKEPFSSWVDKLAYAMTYRRKGR